MSEASGDRALEGAGGHRQPVLSAGTSRRKTTHSPCGTIGVNGTIRASAEQEITMTTAIIGQLSLILETGETLTATSDVRLARQWAEHAHGDEWATMTYIDQNRSIAAALHSIREGVTNEEGE